MADAAGYRDDIEGLRAVAVAAVFLFHLAPERLAGGFVGVDLFFVISVYLITGQIRRAEEAGGFSIVTFYQRRIACIAPAGLFVITCVLAAASMLFLAPDLVALALPAATAATGLFNFQLLRHEGYFAASPDSAPLLHYWSLSVEEQYYLLFPLFLLGALRSRRPLLPLIVVGMASLALALLLTPRAPSVAFYSLPTRAREFVAGALVALVPPLRRDASVPAATLIVGAMLFTQAANFPGWQAMIPVTGAALLLAGNGEGNVAQNLQAALRSLSRA